MIVLRAMIQRERWPERKTRRGGEAGKPGLGGEERSRHGEFEVQMDDAVIQGDQLADATIILHVPSTYV